MLAWIDINADLLWLISLTRTHIIPFDSHANKLPYTHLHTLGRGSGGLWQTEIMWKIERHESPKRQIHTISGWFFAGIRTSRRVAGDLARSCAATPASMHPRRLTGLATRTDTERRPSWPVLRTFTSTEWIISGGGGRWWWVDRWRDF